MEERISFQAPSGTRLAGVLHRPARAGETGVVVCHGMLSAKESPKHTAIASRLAADGHLALRFDFSGRGESEGDLRGITFTRQVAECRAAVREIRRAGCQRVALVGSSFGGAVAVLSAVEEEPFALVTMASIGDAYGMLERALGEEGLRAWERKGHHLLHGVLMDYSLVEDARRTDLAGAAARIKCPWLILHGERDEVVPPFDAEALHRAAGDHAAIEIIPEADHRFSLDAHREYIIGRIAGFIGTNA